MNLTVIGAGNIGFATAADLTLAGYCVTLYELPRFKQNVGIITKVGGINIQGVSRVGFAKLYRITTNIGEALKDAKYIYIATRSTTHKEIAKICAPYLKSEQIVLISPGYLGSLYFIKEIKKLNRDVKPIFIEGESQPYGCRKIKPDTINITSLNVRNPIASLPANEISNIIPKLRNFYLTYVPAKNIIKTALHNPNLIVHTIGAIMNISRIEYSKGEFWMYKEGFTPSIWNLIHALDNEKMDVLEAYGLERQPFFESWIFRNSKKLNVDGYQVFKDFAQKSNKGPFNSQTRYITEDVPNGLGLLNSLGEKANIPTPLTNALIEVASIINKTDYKAESRSLDDLGIGSYSLEEIKNIIESGIF